MLSRVKAFLELLPKLEVTRTFHREPCLGVAWVRPSEWAVDANLGTVRRLLDAVVLSQYPLQGRALEGGGDSFEIATNRSMYPTFQFCIMRTPKFEAHHVRTR